MKAVLFVVEPDVLLLDEPLSALDAQVRANLREEIRRLQLALGTTTLFVTHDQEEAMAISDRVGVMNRGKLEQIADPDTLYNNPATTFVAGFVGTMNRVVTQISNGKVSLFGQQISAKTGGITSGDVVALIRPEKVSVKTNSTETNATVVTRSFLGASSQLTCRTTDGLLIQALMGSHESEALHPGTPVRINVTSSEVLVSHV